MDMKNSEYLESKGFGTLWHFTHADNIPLIEEIGALCSKEELERMGRLGEVTFVSDDQSRRIDRVAGNWDKVPLSLISHTPMFWKKFGTSLRIYKVSISVADFDGVVFTDTNATYSNRCKCNTPECIEFDLIRGGRYWERFKASQAEVLVPNRVPIEFLTKDWEG